MVKASGASKALEKDGIKTYLRDGRGRGAGGMKTRVFGKALVICIRRTRGNEHQF